MIRVFTQSVHIADLSAHNDKSEEVKQLYEFIAKLDKLNKAIVLLYLEGEPHQSIATSLGISKTNVATRIGRIKETLKNQFEKQGLNMNLDNIKNTWQQQNSVNESAITINQSLLSETKVNKQMKELNAMKWARIIESAAFFFIIVLLGQYIANNFSVSAPSISALILSVFSIAGLAGNIGQIVHIANIDYAKPISQLQKDVYRLCSHKLQLTKLLFMSAPFYMAYVFIGFDVLFEIDLFAHLEQHMVWFYSVSSLLLLIITSCVLAKLNYTNIKAPWVKRTIAFIVGERLVNMAQFINNIDSKGS